MSPGIVRFSLFMTIISYTFHLFFLFVILTRYYIHGAPKCLVRVRNVLWPKCPVTIISIESNPSRSSKNTRQILEKNGRRAQTYARRVQRHCDVISPTARPPGACQPVQLLAGC